MAKKNRSNKDKLQIIITEYKEGAESQRRNLTLGWAIGSILIAISLYMFGISITEETYYFPLMVLSFSILILWYGMYASLNFYTVHRLERLDEIEKELDIDLFLRSKRELDSLGWKQHRYYVLTYVRLFIFVYIVMWILVLLNKLKVIN